MEEKQRNTEHLELCPLPYFAPFVTILYLIAESFGIKPTPRRLISSQAYLPTPNKRSLQRKENMSFKAEI